MIDRILPVRSKSSKASRQTGTENVRVTSNDLLSLHRYARQIGLQTRKIGAQQAGNYLSKFKGRGMEFAEVRPYLPGDDLRSIDWRVTARTGRAHTKLFREEREKPVLIWVDYRRSMFFATRGSFKSVVAARAAALIAWSAIGRGDRLGGLIFNEQRHLEMRPMQGKSAVFHFIRQLVEHPAWDNKPKQNQTPPYRWDLSKLRHGTRPGSSIVLISDFRNLAPDAEKNIGYLAKHNDMTLIFIHDPLECELPPAGQYKISSGSQELLLDTGDRQLRRQHSESFQSRFQQLTKLCRQHRMTLIPSSTEDDLISCLSSGLRTPAG
ncbi:DUF58 domain-containing protein [Malonomonas rubra]|uniref:DUF58 domain-containing protein n=1 Tax=Malonomonas rubra TaxID=57040 RepID=UPI0026F185D3|nr:DUF58 domain-containing protein [Malonomonas rubra]